MLFLKLKKINIIVLIKIILIFILINGALVVNSQPSDSNIQNSNKSHHLYHDYDYSDDDYDVTADRADLNNYNDDDELDYPPLLPIFELYNLRNNPIAFARNIRFVVNKNGQRTYVANGTSREALKDTGCNETDNFTFIIHGWREDTESTKWIPYMVSNFTKYRGGCVIAVDYGVHAEMPYFRLVQRFDEIADVIYNKMKSWRRDGMQLDKTLLFGFSYGGQLSVELGRRFGKKQIEAIDTCDMAGPGFDIRDRGIHHRNAAKNVQCIHTSRDKGTRYYDTCHQNWRLGNCGLSQPGAESPPYGSHGLCVYYYLLAFERNFYARKKPNICTSRSPALSWPDNFKMGYMENRKSQAHGEFFVPLSRDFPYVMPYSKNDDSNDILFYGQLPFETADAIRKFQNRRRRFQNRPAIRRFIRARKEFMDRVRKSIEN